MASKTSPFDPASKIGKTTSVQPSQLNLYHLNPRKGDVPTIVGSLKAHGQYKPICVNLGTFTGRANEVLAGNHTLMAFRTLAETHPDDPRWEEILVHWVDVDNDRAARIVAMDNKASEKGSTDAATLAELLEGLGGDLEGTGYSSDELNELLDKLNGPTGDDFLPGGDSTALDVHDPKPCQKCGYDTANDPENLG